MSIDDTLRKLQSGVAESLRDLTAPAGRRYVPLDPDFKLDGNRIEVDGGLDAAELETARRRFVVDQWAKRDEWTDRAVLSTAARSPSLPIIFLGIGMLSFLLSLGAGLLWGGETWLFAGFLLVFSALWSALSALALLRQRKFRPGELRLSAAPVALGGRLRGRLRTGVTRELKPDGRFELSLCCVHTISSSSDTGSGRQARRTLWSSNVRVQGFIAHADDRFSIEFDLPVPEDQPAWTLGSGAEGIDWELVVKAEMQGLDYSESFPLPVLSIRDHAFVCAAR